MHSDHMNEYHHYSLLPHNTFGIDVACDTFLEYRSVEEAQQVAHRLASSDTPYYIIGEGSNLLLTQDYHGVMVHAAIDYIKPLPDHCVECGAAVKWVDFVAYCVENHLNGVENLALIPGECGSSAVQNIGAYGAEAKDVIKAVNVVEIATGEPRTFTNAQCEYGYRESRFKKDWKGKYLITSVVYQLKAEFQSQVTYGNIAKTLEEKGIPQPSAKDIYEVVTEIRQSKLPDPKEIGNAGSFFMNPVVDKDTFVRLQSQYPAMPYYELGEAKYKIPAGWMIEQCGWKGKRQGHVGVYDKQALVLVNYGGATGAEVVALYRAIQDDVKERFGIEIHPEVNVL